MLRSLAAASLIVIVAADVYMHNPRGSNDRNCERNVNRNNGNRLFDSQNNAKGGYACPRAVGGPNIDRTVVFASDEANFDSSLLDNTNTTYYQKMYYLAGSKLPIEWTSQHGCGGNAKEHCQIVIQYACEDTMDPFHAYDAPVESTRYIGTPRDGMPTNGNDAATDTIPDNANNAVANTAANRRFGMHETQAYYQDCRQRSRNRGLFTADQNLRRNDARATRQNPNGNRNGLECPEERDYYPYWHPNPWIDIAILHDHAPEAEWCAFYRDNSQNKAATAAGVCIPVDTATETPQQVATRKNQGRWHNNEAECTGNGHSWENRRYGIDASTQEGAAKLTALDAVISDVDCQASPSSRINHLGNAEASNYDTASDETNLPHDNNAARYVWTIPQHFNENCVLRVRYNISTSDYPAWSEAVGDAAGTPGLNSTFNGDDDSPITQDPYIYLGQGATEFVSLAVNTNQYGRTFQDRSYVFAIRKPNEATQLKMDQGAKLFNLNVRGKRGNIVQTYPAVEYDFVPNNLKLSTDDLIHFQWTGSDYNPRRGCNNGEGGPPDGDPNQNSRADRSNLVSMELFADQYPNPIAFPQGANPTTTAADRPTMRADTSMFTNTDDVMEMAFIHQFDRSRFPGPCATETELEAINNNNARENAIENCAKLNNAATPYFDAGPKEMSKAGIFAYFSSRNNNFSNRDQTGRLCVAPNANQCDEDAPPTDTVQRVVDSNAAATGTVIPVLAQETFNFNEKDNDSTGDGEKEDCEEFGSFLGNIDDGTAAGLIIGMLIVGAAVTLCCQWGIRWYLVKPKSPQDICCGGDMQKGNRKPVSKKRQSAGRTPPPPPARPTANSWQKGSVGSSLPAPLGNQSPPEPPARRAPHERVPPGPPARKTAASSAVASRQVPPPPPGRQAASAPMGSGPRVIPPPPPRR